MLSWRDAQSISHDCFRSADNPIPIEAELCRQYGASRPAVREAVIMLTAKGLLGSRPRLGSDIAFHVAVLRASRNRFHGQLTGFAATALRFSIRTTNRNKGVQLASMADHKKVADAIIGGRPVAAGEAMRKLIQEALDRITKREAAQVARRTSAITHR